ncbi:Clp protease ClpP [Galbibacter pacificus]|uniref:ATP-dependent Clp protease proteolytic subunit n=1 Tax=Galbibacter pacificus TaxID=2996052 RepID=A0ABT6FR53_9FLAO|nr:Clp protease ClpP [Galbibacter pacificus]MDG3581774.1 Clp protease ClpP [Galbibacter pacificus]MDG3585752.1 Clp protease ClpP [Galbibacter pacificus]
MEQATIYINGVIGEDVTLLDVIRQINGYASFNLLNVHINSIGGDYNEGFAIYDYLIGLKSKYKVNTRATGDVMSIATVIYMAGDERYAENSSRKNFMLHLPWAEAKGTAEDFKNYSTELEKAENELNSFYVENLKNVDEKTVTNLTKTDLYLNADEAFDLGLVTNLEIPFKAVAKLTTQTNNEEENKTNFMSKFEEKVNAIFNKLFPKALKEVQDGTGVTIVFEDVEAGEEVEKGDKATIDGAPANGKYVMPDGTTYVFVDGVLNSIEVAEAEETTEEEEVVAEAEEILSMEEFEKILEMLNKNVESILALTQANENLKLEIKNLKKSVGSDFELDDEVEEKKVKTTLTRAAQIMRS